MKATPNRPNVPMATGERTSHRSRVVVLKTARGERGKAGGTEPTSEFSLSASSFFSILRIQLTSAIVAVFTFPAAESDAFKWSLSAAVLVGMGIGVLAVGVLA